mgnify:CR=1 FL=1|tara:strand:- start:57 stop:530 length:474 start_codon:yes stop_codon:yes gene_type:complete
MNEAKTIRSAANELARYVDDVNTVLKSAIRSTDLDDPGYHDHQACFELLLIANKYEALQAKLDAAEAHIKALESAGDAIIDLIDLPSIPHNQRCKIVKFDSIKRQLPAQSLARVQAEAITKLIAERSECASVDGVAETVIYAGEAEKFINELLRGGE